VIGRLRAKLPADTTLVVMSDHGFKSYRRKFSLNTWLYDNGYLVLKPGLAKERAAGDPAFDVVSIENAGGLVEDARVRRRIQRAVFESGGPRARRRGHQENEAGIVKRGSEADALLRELKTEARSAARRRRSA
jgi:predicted AlkP superfamily phosphohydrolase/phosphomutase